MSALARLTWSGLRAVLLKRFTQPLIPDLIRDLGQFEFGACLTRPRPLILSLSKDAGVSGCSFYKHRYRHTGFPLAVRLSSRPSDRAGRVQGGRYR